MLTTSTGVAAKNATPEDDMKTVKIKITRATVCAGEDVFKGDVVEATEKDARMLFAMKKAVPADIQTKKGRGSK